MRWILSWLKKFWSGHGERMLFGSIAFAFAAYFMGQETQELKGAGLTIMIGLAMAAFNKARGGSAAPDEKPAEPPKE